MIGLDTNVLLRFLTQDDVERSARARRFLADNCSAARPGYINLVVLAELVRTLERFYQYPRTAVATTLLQVIDAEELVVQHADQVRAACTAFLAGRETGNVGLADHIILALNRPAACETTATMDRRFAREAETRLI